MVESPGFTKMRLVGQDDNRFLLAENMQKVKETYKKKLAGGSVRMNYNQVIIVGDEKVGKTSLNRRLRGLHMRSNEDRTYGIEQCFVSTKFVNKQWTETTHSIETDISNDASYLTAEQLTDKVIPKANPTDVYKVVSNMSHLLFMVVVPTITMIMGNFFCCGFGVVWLVSAFWCFFIEKIMKTNNSFLSIIDSLTLGLTMVHTLITKDGISNFANPTYNGTIIASYMPSSGILLAAINTVIYILICCYGGCIVGFLQGLPTRKWFIFTAFLWKDPFANICLATPAGLCNCILCCKKALIPDSMLGVLYELNNTLLVASNPSSHLCDSSFVRFDKLFIIIMNFILFIVGTAVGLGVGYGPYFNYWIACIKQSLILDDRRRHVNIFKIVPAFLYGCRYIFIFAFFVIVWFSLDYVGFIWYKNYAQWKGLLDFWSGLLFGICYAQMSKVKFIKSYLYTFHRAINCVIGFSLSMMYFRSIGWEFVDITESRYPALAVIVAAILTRVSVELIRFKTKKNFEKDDVPLLMISNHFTNFESGQLNMPRKLMMRDFAGEKKFHTWYYAFMQPHAVYIIVFNLQNAVATPNAKVQISRIKYWVNSIFSHTGTNSDSRILIVGTHRNSITDKKLIDNFSRSLLEEIYPGTDRDSSCCDRVISNGKEIFFEIDNETTPDSGFESLRKCIWENAFQAKLAEQKFPIVWKKCLQEILRSGEKKIFVESDSTYNHLKSKGLTISRKDYEELLVLFAQAGHITYLKYDEGGQEKKCIVLAPELIAYTFAKLTDYNNDIPPRFKKAYTQLQKEGTIQEKFLQHILKLALEKYSKKDDKTEEETNEQSSSTTGIGPERKVLLRLLESHQYICRVSKDKYIIPSLLPEKPSCSGWNTDSCDTFCFDFEGFHPDHIFDRLIVRCLVSREFSTGEYKDGHLFRGYGIFTSDDWSYCIEVQCWKAIQNVIILKVARCGSSTLAFFHKMHVELQDICKKSFPSISFHSGFQCETVHGINRDSPEHIVGLITSGGDRRWSNDKLKYSCGNIPKWKSWAVADEKQEIVSPIRNEAPTTARNMRPMQAQPSDQVLQSLSRCVGHEWKRLAVALGFTFVEADQFQMTPNDPQSTIQAMLCSWRNRLDSNDDAIFILSNALKEVGRNDLAANVMREN